MMRHFCVVGILLASMVAWSAAADPAKAAVRDIHSRQLTPPSDALFAAESKAPNNEKEWSQLAASASMLAEGARRLAALSATKSEKNWQSLAARLRVAAEDARVAATGRNLDALISANGRVVATCEACHDDYRDAGHGMTSDKPPSQ